MKRLLASTFDPNTEETKEKIVKRFCQEICQFGTTGACSSVRLSHGAWQTHFRTKKHNSNASTFFDSWLGEQQSQEGNLVRALLECQNLESERDCSSFPFQPALSPLPNDSDLSQPSPASPPSNQPTLSQPLLEIEDFPAEVTVIPLNEDAPVPADLSLNEQEKIPVPCDPLDQDPQIKFQGREELHENIQKFFYREARPQGFFLSIWFSRIIYPKIVRQDKTRQSNHNKIKISFKRSHRKVVFHSRIRPLRGFFFGDI